MTISFFEHGGQRCEEVVRPGVLCAFDFDGTLVPIVTQPERARLPAGIRRRLNELTCLAPTAIITGRSLADIRERVDCRTTYLVGNHGIEGVPGHEDEAARHAQFCREWMAELGHVLQDHARFDPGIRIEDKTYSLSVHYRLARNRELVEAQLARLFVELLPEARVMGGKCVFNLLPPGAVDKGIALERLMQACGATHAVYVGDDVTDEDVFRRKQEQVLTVRVGHESGSAAEFFVNHRIHMCELLDILIDRLRRLQPAVTPTGTALVGRAC